jgi:hypothetical protein
MQAITGEERQTAGSQHLTEGVDEQVRRMLCAGTQREYGQNLGERIDDQPQPEHLRGAAEPGSNFVQLQVRDVQVAEAALVQGLCVPTSTGKPGGDGRLPIALRPVRQPIGPALRPAQITPWRPAGREFSDDTTGCDVEQ